MIEILNSITHIITAVSSCVYLDLVMWFECGGIERSFCVL